MANKTKHSQYVGFRCPLPLLKHIDDSGMERTAYILSAIRAAKDHGLKRERQTKKTKPKANNNTFGFEVFFERCQAHINKTTNPTIKKQIELILENVKAIHQYMLICNQTYVRQFNLEQNFDEEKWSEISAWALTVSLQDIEALRLPQTKHLTLYQLMKRMQ